MQNKIGRVIIVFIISILCLFSITYARNYNVDYSNTESDLDCWVGWKDWHFGATTPLSKKGDTITYKRPVIYSDGSQGYFESEATTNGYGHYAFDFGKHILGLLSFIKNKITDYQTTYVPIYDQPEFDEYGNIVEPQAVSIRNAIEITITKLLRTWYSKVYEENEFSAFWDKGIKFGNYFELKKLQNMFYWQAYGQEAFGVLTRMMGSSYTNLTPKQKRTLKGVLFSVMEARYRNKNLQGKANLKLKAAEGEILPFLVNLKNLNFIVREGSAGHYSYKDSKRGYTYYVFPSFDDLIDGAYLWMEYYDKDTIAQTTHSTLTSYLNQNTEGEEIEVDWESEYQDLTGMPLKTLSNKELQEFYDKCYKVKSIFKKSTENAEGIFGAEELYDITSEVNFSQALENMKNKMIEFCNGADFGSVWTGLTDYNIERTYMMAKNIMESNKIKDEYAYYDIGTNIITYTPGLSGKEFMLMDLQKIELKQPLEVIENGRRIKTKEDSDNDGILDRNELGDATSDSDRETTMKIKVDITGFIKKAVERELYGNDEKEINKNQAYIKEVVSKVKFNIYNQRNKFDKENSENNKLNWKEVYENNLNVDDDTKRALDILDTDTAKQQYLKIAPAKLEVELWKYKSNPVLKDTDFDGIEDGFGYERDSEGDYKYDDKDKKIPIELNSYKDKTPKDNYFTGRMHSTRLSGDDGLDVEMNMDYRYFFLSNKLYYDELSTMSLLYSNSIYRRGRKEKSNEYMDYHSGLQIKSGNNLVNGEDRTNKTYKKEEIKNMDLDKFNNMQVKEMMEHFGFKNVRTYYMGEEGDEAADGADVCRGYKDTHKGKVALGYKNIEYHGLCKTVIGIVIRGTAEDDDWDSDFDMGDLDLRDELNYAGGRNNYDDNYDKIYSKLSNGILNYDKNYSAELLHFAGGYPDWKWDYHHAGFDIVSNRILEIVKEYYDEVEKHFDDDVELFDDEENKYVDGGVCFWVTGHSMGAGVANLVASSLICSDNVDIISGIGGNENNVYCYTFASPNTFYLTDNTYERKSFAIPGKKVTGDYREPHGVRYRCIFNIVNDDDFVTKVPMKECNWTRYGRVAELSIEANLTHRYVRELGQGYRYNPSEIHNEEPIEHSNVPYRLYVVKHYVSSLAKVTNIINLFNGIFNDKSNMRREAYSYSIWSADYSSENELKEGLGTFAKPYQKYTKYNDRAAQLIWCRQYQMPVYFMQSLANSLHEYFVSLDENKSKIIEKEIDRTQLINDKQKEFINAKMGFPYLGAKWYTLYAEGLFKVIDAPHYLESYYTLTKELTTVDFR